ncbi:hypothetical protein BYT27DRAFT_6489094 [Phlegmacium glaucopus]|nr:hypothetical protein BYT27DRAFT_6489094 [Phlegmacium glaucopus]
MVCGLWPEPSIFWFYNMTVTFINSLLNGTLNHLPTLHSRMVHTIQQEFKMDSRIIYTRGE